MLAHVTKVTTAAMLSACPHCGTVAKSGKVSCCGHGGAWFGTCGSPGSGSFEHSWYEGMQACNTWFNAAAKLSSSNRADIPVSVAAIVTARSFTFSTSDRIAPAPDRPPYTTASTPKLIFINETTTMPDGASTQHDAGTAKSKVTATAFGMVFVITCL